MSLPVLEVSDLCVDARTASGTISIVQDVSFRIDQGETLGLVGESASGKTTLGKAVSRLIEPSSGTIRIVGTELATQSRADLRRLRRRVQMIFQDSFASLDPRWTVQDLIEEPLRIHRAGSRAMRRQRVAELLRQVGLNPDAAGRYPHEFSGGQRQRLSIARALALSPDLVICDEPLSALDVSIQAQVLNLLVDLRSRLNVSFLFISHDLSVVRYLCDRIAVMYLGRIIEIGPREAVWSAAAHPYTQALLAAIPQIDTSGRRPPRRRLIEGDPPSPYSHPPGCPFHTRCPYAEERCRLEIPLPRSVDATGRLVSCHFAGGKIRPGQPFASAPAASART